LHPISWNDSQVPSGFLELQEDEELPTIDDVLTYLDTEALGYAFWRPKRWMLVRFNRPHYDNHIANSSRIRIFKKVDLTDVTRINSLIHQEAQNFQRNYGNYNLYQLPAPSCDWTEKDLKKLVEQGENGEQYVFCLAKYYEGDLYVIQRLLKWGKQVKVILPYSLQAQLLAEIKATYDQYF
jgi:CRISPR-associated protein (TIGR03985 family)